MTRLRTIFALGLCSTVITGLVFYAQTTSRHTTTPRTIGIFSVSGKSMSGFFDGVKPNARIANVARKYQGARLESCTPPKRLLNKAGMLLSKVGDLLGLTPQVVHAQGGCLDCYITYTTVDCSGGAPCDDYQVDQPTSGGGIFCGYSEGEDICGDPDQGCPALYDTTICFDPFCIC
jgi:hypothetical protein